MENKKMSLYEKIQAVSLEVNNLEKDMTVGSGSNAYKAVSDKNVILAVKKAEEKYRILSIPGKQELISHEVLTLQKKDGQSLLYVDNIKMTMKIVDLDNPDNSIEIDSHGKGVDYGDKGLGKASTYARKYALLNAYKIATGEDPDAYPSKKDNLIVEDTIRLVVENFLLQNTDYRNNVFSHFNVGMIEDLSDSQIKSIHKNLKDKGRL